MASRMEPSDVLGGPKGTPKLNTMYALADHAACVGRTFRSANLPYLTSTRTYPLVQQHWNPPAMIDP
jgi:hypothetical protein